MKSLNDYMQAKQTALFKKTQSFFAFGAEQFNEKKQENVIYVNMGHGLICPKETAQELKQGLEKIYHDAIQEDIAENGQDAIILRELYNHECFYTCEIEDAVNALTDYNFDINQIIKVYHNERAKQ